MFYLVEKMKRCWGAMKTCMRLVLLVGNFGVEHNLFLEVLKSYLGIPIKALFLFKKRRLKHADVNQAFSNIQIGRYCWNILEAEKVVWTKHLKECRLFVGQRYQDISGAGVKMLRGT